MNKSRVWLEVNVNVGKRSLLIAVRKGESIDDVVSKFITDHGLSPQYHNIIVNMIKQEVRLKTASQETFDSLYDEEQQNQPTTPTYLHRTPYDNRHQERDLSPKNQGHNYEHQSTTVHRTKDSGEGQLLSEMKKIKDDIEKKREKELEKVRTRKNQSVEQLHKPQSTKRKQVGLVENRWETANSREILEESIPQETRKGKVFRKIEQQKSKLSTPSEVLKKQTTEPQIYESNLRDDISELKGLLNDTYRSRMTMGHHITGENSYSKLKLKSAMTPKNKEPVQQNISSKKQQEKKGPREIVKPPKPNESIEDVYNKWKKMEEKRKKETQHKKSKTPVKSIEKHENSFFYDKGNSFLKEKQKKIDENFKKVYPFKRTDGSLTPDKTANPKAVTQRLYREAKEKSLRNVEIEAQRLAEIAQADHSPRLPADPIREKVRQRDRQYDEAMSQLIKQGKVTNTVRIASKSPNSFRRTRVF